MRHLFILTLVTSILSFASCSKYKATLQVTVTDTLDSKIEKADVYLMSEENAKAFQMGISNGTTEYFSGKTNADGVIPIKITEMNPIYGVVYKDGYYYEQFFVQKPLINRSKNNITVKLIKKRNTE
jgi:hypothetical protein